MNKILLGSLRVSLLFTGAASLRGNSGLNSRGIAINSISSKAFQELKFLRSITMIAVHVKLANLPWRGLLLYQIVVTAEGTLAQLPETICAP